MPEKIKYVIIYLDDEEKVYRPGDTVKGYWELTSEKEFKTKGILSYFRGVALVKWTENNTSLRKDDEFTSYEMYVRETIQLHGIGDNKENIQPGVYKYPFAFKIPQRPLPSSYEGSKGAIRYFIQIRIRRPIPFPDVTRYKCITVLEEIDVNQSKFKKSLELSNDCNIWMGNAETVELEGSIDRRGYCSGEKIALSVIAKNNSKKKLGKVKAQIMQYVTYTGSGKEDCVSNTIKYIQSSTELEAGKIFKWTNMLIQLDNIPPTVDRLRCQCICVNYYLEVVVPASFLTGSDLKLRFPITIGTVPLGKSLTSSKAFDASNAITYTTCNDGYAVFGQSSSSRDFPRASYTPMCAYAVNYIFQKHRKRVATPNQNTRTLSTKSTSTSESTASVKDPKPVSTPTTHSSTPTESVKPAITSSTPTESVKPATPSSTSTASLKPATPSSTYTEPVKPSLEARATIQPVAPLPSTSCSSNSNHQHDTASSSTNNQTTTGQEESDALQLSYEEAIRTQNSEADNTSDEEESDVWYMVIRFTKAALDEFMIFIERNRNCLDLQEGHVLFKSRKAYDVTGYWPKEKDTIVMLSFPSKKQASDWVILPEVKESKWFSGSDIIITSVKEQYQSGKLTVTVSELSENKEDENAVARYQKLVDNILKPLRLIHGGQQCVRRKFSDITETWKTTENSIISIMVWPNIQAVKNYMSSISELQMTIVELKTKCIAIHSSRTFDVQELSPELAEEVES